VVPEFDRPSSSVIGDGAGLRVFRRIWLIKNLINAKQDRFNQRSFKSQNLLSFSPISTHTFALTTPNKTDIFPALRFLFATGDHGT
ncbi:10446_t:CDS:2, partial [Paraglomus occultum]